MNGARYETPTQILQQDSPAIPNEAIVVTVNDDEVLQEVCTENRLLAEALDMYKSYGNGALPIQQETLRTILTTSADDLVNVILPCHDQTRRHDATAAPMLTDLFLLLRTYDITHDATTKEALDYIFIHVPPAASEPVAHAYHRAIKRRTSIMDEYCKISRHINANVEAIDRQREDAEAQWLEAQKELHRLAAERQQQERRQRRIARYVNSVSAK